MRVAGLGPAAEAEFPRHVCGTEARSPGRPAAPPSALGVSPGPAWHPFRLESHSRLFYSQNVSY